MGYPPATGGIRKEGARSRAVESAPTSSQDTVMHSPPGGSLTLALRQPARAAALIVVLIASSGCTRSMLPPPAAPGAVSPAPSSGPPSDDRAVSPDPSFEPPGDDVWSEEGVAAWYGAPFHGRPTASGESYDMNAMTGRAPDAPLRDHARCPESRQRSIHDGAHQRSGGLRRGSKPRPVPACGPGARDSRSRGGPGSFDPRREHTSAARARAHALGSLGLLDGSGSPVPGRGRRRAGPPKPGAGQPRPRSWSRAVSGACIESGWDPSTPGQQRRSSVGRSTGWSSTARASTSRPEHRLRSASSSVRARGPASRTRRTPSGGPDPPATCRSAAERLPGSNPPLHRGPAATSESSLWQEGQMFGRRGVVLGLSGEVLAGLLDGQRC